MVSAENEKTTEPGSGLLGVLIGPLGTEQMDPEPLSELSSLKVELRRLRLWRRVCFAIGVILFAVALGALVLGGIRSALSPALGAVFFFVLRGLLSTRYHEERVYELEFYQEIKKELAGQVPAYKLFKAHQFELRRYYDQTLRHSRVMLVAGLACILIGVFVVGGAIWAVLDPGFFGAEAATDGFEWSKVIVGLLGAVGGILINYVAAVYLKMYAAASVALNDFHNRLVTTHHVHFANLLAEKIKDPEKRDDALKDMAKELA